MTGGRDPGHTCRVLGAQSPGLPGLPAHGSPSLSFFIEFLFCVPFLLPIQVHVSTVQPAMLKQNTTTQLRDGSIRPGWKEKVVRGGRGRFNTSSTKRTQPTRSSRTPRIAAATQQQQHMAAPTQTIKSNHLLYKNNWETIPAMNGENKSEIIGRLAHCYVVNFSAP